MAQRYAKHLTVLLGCVTLSAKVSSLKFHLANAVLAAQHWIRAEEESFRPPTWTWYRSKE
jgi:hypothetical protein